MKQMPNMKQQLYQSEILLFI